MIIENADVIENGTVDTDNDIDGTIWNDKRNDMERSENIEVLMLAKMKADNRISVKQLAKIFGKSKTSMFRIIEKLKAEKKVRRVGSEKAGIWEVFE